MRIKYLFTILLVSWLVSCSQPSEAAAEEVEAPVESSSLESLDLSESSDSSMKSSATTIWKQKANDLFDLVTLIHNESVPDEVKEVAKARVYSQFENKEDAKIFIETIPYVKAHRFMEKDGNPIIQLGKTVEFIGITPKPNDSINQNTFSEFKWVKTYAK